MRRPFPGQSAAARNPERAALLLGQMATASGGGTSSAYMIFEHDGELYRSQWDETTGDRVWTRWPSGEIVGCPMGEVG